MAYYNIKSDDKQLVAVEESGKCLTYAQLADESKRIGSKLQKRSLIFQFCQNTIGSLCGYISFLDNGSVPLLVDLHLEEELAQGLIKKYEPDYIYVPIDKGDQFRNYQVVLECYDYILFETDYNHNKVMHSELALLLTTSGSTGSPKLVRQSYANIQANATSIAQYLELDQSERPITTLPMNYTYGLSIINSHLLTCATILLTNRSLVEKTFWDFFEKEGATSFGGVPYNYEILKKLHFLKKDYPCLKTMTQAGGKLSPELHKEFAQYAKDNGKKFIVMYGQTEATARMSYLPHNMSIEKYGSMGIAIPGGEFSLIDVEGNEIKEANVVGELVYKGPNVTLGYAECLEDLQKGDERQGILVTGDMALIDGDGYYYIVGRKKRFLKIYGNRVNLDEIERILKSKYEGLQFACTGKDDLMYIFMSGKSDCEDLDLNQIREYISGKLGLYQKAFLVKEIDEIPLNEAGKVLYSKLENYF